MTGFAYTFSHLDALNKEDDDDEEDDDEDDLDDTMPSDKKAKKVKLTPEEKAASKPAWSDDGLCCVPDRTAVVLWVLTLHLIAEKERKEAKKAKRKHEEGDAAEPADAEAASNGSVDVVEDASTPKAKRNKAVGRLAVDATAIADIERCRWLIKRIMTKVLKAPWKTLTSATKHGVQ
jgi:hypothetical protein